ncbi:MazG-like family protein [Peptoniphilus sp. MSJ-1]|uniref:MazG-like family protein n=1 Tax=Peptoniphilus ovalis TaxID=2841503 RepID=A0ABS6FJC5_9FIRM|nr:MazG-like family protein [Peptoniphilus ovalis]MBU5669538.1 MazG-like family protein [Peptoniphilus ovalis]
MKELNEKIIKWAKDRDLDTKGTVEGQSIKTAEEISELIKGISKENLEMIKDSIGDIYVTLVIGNMLSKNIELNGIYEEVLKWQLKFVEEIKKENNKKTIINTLARNIQDVLRDNYNNISGLKYFLGNLIGISIIYNLEFKECVESAYNEIANRKGKTIDGQFIKEEDL